MTDSEYSALMPFIVSDFVAYIAKNKKFSESEALDYLYSSKLYSMLEDEKMKLWHYSSFTLFNLLEQEKQTSKIEFPDV